MFSVAMFIAIVATLFSQDILELQWILVAAAVGGIIGAFAAQRVAMTSMPEMVALFNGSGGVTSLLVGWAALYLGAPSPNTGSRPVEYVGVTVSTFTVVTIWL